MGEAEMEILGIDIGGSGIKGAPVDVARGELTAERLRIATPQPATPDAVADGVAEIARAFQWQGPIGCTFPAIVKGGVVFSAANVDKSWINTPGQSLFAERTGCPVVLVNDADAAGIAEMRFGAGVGKAGLVMMLTFGTGIGSALFYNGVLIPNSELGHMELKGKDAEDRASDRVRKEKELTWEQWAGRVNKYLARLDLLFSPDLYIIGGGVSKRQDKFLHLLRTPTPVMMAEMLNEAGIVGAALAAAEK
jgi:polyphosphate glucokinase